MSTIVDVQAIPLRIPSARNELNCPVGRWRHWLH
jgi:hypothetical protein